MDTLTDRQIAVLKLLSDGLTNKEIASKLGISTKTAEAHRANIMYRLQINTLSGLVKYALKTGLTSLENDNG